MRVTSSRIGEFKVNNLTYYHAFIILGRVHAARFYLKRIIWRHFYMESFHNATLLKVIQNLSDMFHDGMKTR